MSAATEESPSTVVATVPRLWELVDDRTREQFTESIGRLADRLDRGVIGKYDQASMLPSLARLSSYWATHPDRMMQASLRWTGQAWQAWMAAGARALGADVPGPVEPPRDKRFADKAWTDSPAYWFLHQQHLLLEQAVAEFVDDAELSESDRQKATFALKTIVDAVSPTNFPATNPTVIKRAVETGGQSVAKGARTFVHDMLVNEGQPEQFAKGVYEVGRELAVTPGKVVFRNDLMELLQYSPTTETVHEIPLLVSPPWINKYYVMDLSPGRSLVQWAVDHGHTVFLISYRNPDQTMADVSMDDYLLSGPMKALDVIGDITGSPKVNLLALCLGGTLAMSTLGYLHAIGDDRVNSATFLNTLVDFSEPGALGVFTDERSVAKLEKSMAKTGFLPGGSMRKTFDLLRGNDLIWNYVVNNWLLGQDPPAFDLLTWNADSTRMPADMHSFYLRSCYLDNQLATGRMELAGTHLDISELDQDMYFLAAEQDHIAPWRSSYRGARIPKGDVRFVLSNSGHIAGIVNPPNPKSRHWVGTTDELPADPDQWKAEATMHPVTWWEDWAEWIGERAGLLTTPPPSGSDSYPALGDAPGTYVLGT